MPNDGDEKHAQPLDLEETHHAGVDEGQLDHEEVLNERVEGDRQPHSIIVGENAQLVRDLKHHDDQKEVTQRESDEEGPPPSASERGEAEDEPMLQNPHS